MDSTDVETNCDTKQNVLSETKGVEILGVYRVGFIGVCGLFL